MRISQFAAVGAMIGLFAVSVAAHASSDLAGLPICKTLRSMPRGYRPLECDSRSPLKGNCRFLLSERAGPIEYLLENGTVIDKRISLRAGSPGITAFGVARNDGPLPASRKMLASTGLKTHYWTDSDDATISYLQSTDIGCGPAKSYSVYIWFRHGKAESVSVSTLPVD